MKSLNSLLLLSILICAISCMPEKKTDYYGMEISDKDAKSIEALNALPIDTTSTELTLKGTVDKVCQAKGCWMTLENKSGDPIRVTFKDYGFFVPKNLGGKEVVVKGKVKSEVLSEKKAKHYAEDAGEEYDSTLIYKEYAFVADGVLVK